MRIKKMYQGTVPENKILDTYSTSATDTYSCNYVNGLETYSTSETNTGKKWIDGKPIYRKVVVINNFAVGDNVNYNHGISNIESVVSCEGTFNFGDGQIYVYPLISHSGKILGVIATPTLLLWVGNDSWGASTTRIHTFILEYTKTND